MFIDLVKKYRKNPVGDSNHMPMQRIIDLCKQSENKTRVQPRDIIKIWGGANNDIRYKVQVLGVAGDDIYLNWDCYWSPIQDNEERKIEIVQKAR